MGLPWPGSGRARRGPLAPGRSGASDRGQLRRGAGGAQPQHRAAPARFSPPGRAAPLSLPRCRAPSRFQDDFAAVTDATLPEHARGKPLELWWQHEARIGQQGALTRVWAERGSRPVAPGDRRYSWAYILGSTCPARGTGAALVPPFANAGMMDLHPVEIAANVTPDAHGLLTIDGAGWRRTGGKLRIPSRISRPIARSSTLSKTSGSICAATSAAIACSTAIRPSSMPAPTLGYGSIIGPNASPYWNPTLGIGHSMKPGVLPGETGAVTQEPRKRLKSVTGRGHKNEAIPRVKLPLRLAR